MKQSKNLNKRLMIWAGLVGAVLLIPLITQAPWSPGDFIFAGTVLFGAAAGYELISSRLSNRMHRIIVAAGAIGGVILIWAWAVA